METKINSFWLDVKDHFLKQKGGNQIYRSWLDPVIPSKIEQKGSHVHLTLQTPSELHNKWLQEHFLKDFYKYFHSFYKGFLKVHLEVLPHLPFAKLKNQELRLSQKSQNLFFNLNYVFENFIVGESNRLAYGASLAMVTKPKEEAGFNPLFIYSPSGLGKTHLLHAIGQKYLAQNPDSKILYLSAERFLNEYITSLKNKQMESFRKKFRKNCDLLLMDDIQIISKGRGVQEEFFHTFNDLYNRGIKMVICCDQAPGSLPFLEDRIKTRLEGGLMTDIHYPDRETRMAILKNKLEKRDLFISTKGLDLIVESCKKSIREMEGVLNKIKIMTELYTRAVSLQELKTLLTNIKKNLDVEAIQNKVSKKFGISIEELKSSSRKKQIVTARHIAIYLIRQYLKKSLKDISISFGKKDHTTVLNSIKKVEKLKRICPDLKRIIEDLHKEIHNEY